MYIDDIKFLIQFLLCVSALSFPSQTLSQDLAWGKRMHSYFLAGKTVKENKLTKNAIENTIVVRGKCYVGPGTTQTTDSGTIKFCIRPLAINNSSGCDRWDQVYESAWVTPSGSISTQFNRNRGAYYIAVHFPPYALQWWNSTSIHEQPTEVSLTNDTINCEFHFVKGGQLFGKLVRPSRMDGESTRLSLLDTTGLTILTTYCDSGGEFAFDCIPLGSYYIRAEELASRNRFYPNSQYANNAHPFKFTTPGQIVKDILWILNEDPDTSTIPAAKFTVLKPDTGGELAIVRQYIGTGDFSFASKFPGDSIEMHVKAGRKFFLGRISNPYDPSAISISYFPGSFLRSMADTLVLSHNELRSFVLPLATGGRIRGVLPAYTSRFMTLEPILTQQNYYKSLGAEYYVDKFGLFRMSAPVGRYALWFVPYCEGYYRESGWGAFGKEDVTVDSGQAIQLSELQSVHRAASIQGTILCSADPLVACFDTAGRCMSMSVTRLFNYFENLTGNRWRCFNYSPIYAPPYKVRYSLNCLPVGRYAVVIAEPPSNPNLHHRISWYGGPTYYRTIVGSDDVASLDVPTGVMNVEVVAPNQTVELSEASIAYESTRKHSNAMDLIELSQVLPNVLRIRILHRVSHGLVRIYGAGGRILVNEEYRDKIGVMDVHLSGQYSCGVAICSIILDGVHYGKKIMILK